MEVIKYNATACSHEMDLISYRFPTSDLLASHTAVKTDSEQMFDPGLFSRSL
jgi:hypothetical protein